QANAGRLVAAFASGAQHHHWFGRRGGVRSFAGSKSWALMCNSGEKVAKSSLKCTIPSPGAEKGSRPGLFARSALAWELELTSTWCGAESTPGPLRLDACRARRRP